MTPKRSPVAALAASTAHDLNNPLAYIVSNLRFCQDMLARPESPTSEQLQELKDALRDVKEGVDKMRAIVEGLKSLSRAEESLSAGATPAAATPPKIAVRAGKPLVAVIDDDEMITQAIARILSDHEVVPFTDARAALLWLETHQPVLVLCDVVMPGMSGPELYSRLGETNAYPRERIVFITGNAAAEPTARFLDSVENARVFKPFEADTLRAVVRALSR